MYARTLLLAGSLLLAGFGACQAADFVTAKITSWDPVSRTLVLADKTRVESIPADVAVPEMIAAGQSVTVSYIGSEDGIQQVLSVEIAQ